MICQSKNIASRTAELFCSNCRNPKALEGPWLKKSKVWIYTCFLYANVYQRRHITCCNTRVVALCYTYSALRDDIKMPLDTWYTHARKKIIYFLRNRHHNRHNRILFIHNVSFRAIISAYPAHPIKVCVIHLDQLPARHCFLCFIFLLP